MWNCPVNLQFGFLNAFHKVKAPHRHHKRKNSTKIFPLRRGLHRHAHTNASVPFLRETLQLQLHHLPVQAPFLCKILGLKERHESQVVDLSDQAWLQEFYQNLSLASNGSQIKQAQKIAHVQAIRLSVIFITAYFCMSVDLGEQATQHLQLISPVHCTQFKGKRKNNWEQAALFILSRRHSCLLLLPKRPCASTWHYHLSQSVA